MEEAWMKHFAVLVPKSAIADLVALRDKASELNRTWSLDQSLWWHGFRGQDVAFCFQNHAAAVMFLAYCTEQTIPRSPGWRIFSVKDIQDDLPEWPDDVIDQWLVYFANEPDLGWPPPEPFDNHRWGRILGARPLSWWREVTWKKEKIMCDLASLSTKSRRIVDEMIREINSGKADASTKRRFRDAYHYILNNATFPKPVLAMKVPTGLTVLDGSHRMGAFCALQKMPDENFERLRLKKAAPEQEVWLGTHARGEPP
jgi:hypothetical protein